jgi:hypothetical protein
LQELAQAAALDASERSQLACLRDELEDGDAIAHALAAAVEDDRDNAELNFRLGRRLLDEGDAAGIGAIEAAMHLDPGYDDAGLERLHRWHRAHGDEVAAERVVARARTLGEIRERALRQRQGLAAQDDFQAHGLSAEQVGALQSAIARFGKVAEAWIARKQLERDDGAPHYVVAVRWRSFALTGDSTMQKFVDMLPLDGSWQALEQKNLGKSALRFQKAAEQVWPKHG